MARTSWPRRDRGSLAPAFKCNSKVNEAAQASLHCAANLIGFNLTAASASASCPKKKPYGCTVFAAAASLQPSSQVLAAQVAWQTAIAASRLCGPTRRIRYASCDVRELVFDFCAVKKVWKSLASPFWQYSPAILSPEYNQCCSICRQGNSMSLSRFDFYQCS